MPYDLPDVYRDEDYCYPTDADDPVRAASEQGDDRAAAEVYQMTVDDCIAEASYLPMTHLTLEDARNKLAGWHFAKECLSDGELEILYVAEAALREIDRRAA